MSVKVANNRLIDFSLRAGFYQQIFSNVSSLQKSGEQLVHTIEVAHSYRKTNTVEELGQVLSHHPIKEYRLIGQYYLGWCAYRKGEVAQTVFENIVEASQTYRTKALWSLGAIESSRNNHEAEFKYFLESLKYATDLPTRIDLVRGIAVVKAKEGYHAQALKDLENLIPSLRFAKSHTYYDCLNSYAVELAEAGRIEEAKNVSRIVLASPYAFAYPEWRETGNDIAFKGYKARSAVQVTHSFSGPINLVRLPVPEPQLQPARPKRGKVLSYMDWKEKKAKESISHEFDKMSDKDLVIKIFELAAEDGMTWRKLRRIVDYILKVHSEPY